MEPIAIIGMSCRFPGAKNPEKFWQMMSDGVDAITEIPPDRWDVDRFYDSKLGQGKMNTRWGGFLEQVDQFDPHFFGIAPREAMYIDPQQRLLLELGWEALEDAGQVIEQLARSITGVFVGISCNDYHQHCREGYTEINPYMATGNAFSIAANRLSYMFDLRGPSMAIDTACSSSLVAVHLACQSLRSGESNLALAGGVNLLLSPELTIILSQAQMMSPDGRCKTFDASANGYVRGEGCGIVVLKRLSDAKRDNDKIVALIRGSAINQDGRSYGLTAPNGPSQEALIRQALENAEVAASQIGYVELHGTGTSLGDPIEAEALGTVLSEGRTPGNRCAVGSVKTNIGHLESAAGIAGLIKVALMLQHRKIPASLHFQKPNPYIPFDKLPLKVQQTLESWPDNDEAALAGVSSFGFGGTNSHIILEEFLPLEARQGSGEQGSKGAGSGGTNTESDSTLKLKFHPIKKGMSRDSKRKGQRSILPVPLPLLLPLSARTPEALRSLAQNHQKFIANTTVSLQDICYTASKRRSHHDHRLSLVFHNRDELTKSLNDFLHGGANPGLSSGHKQRNHHQKLVFVFSGQGPQWWGMGRELLSSESVFRATLEQCETLLAPLASWSLMEELAADESQSRLGETEIAQPAIFALQVALAALWRSWGVEPSAIVGHSLGEVAAAYVAGALSLEDAVRIVFHRGRLMQQGMGQGKMAAVPLPCSEAEDLLTSYAGRLSIAAINSPTSIVLSGEAAALEEVIQSLEERQIFCKFLPVNYAFHSPQMEPYQDEYMRSLQGINPQAASIPIISTITGKAQDGREFNSDYWRRSIREPVQFAAAIEQLAKTKRDLFIELSPHPVLAMNISQCLQASSRPGVVLPSLRRQEAEKFVMLRSLGSLYTLGYPIKWNKFYHKGGRCVSLPSYPWQRERYWVGKENVSVSVSSSPAVSSLNVTELKLEFSITKAEFLAELPQERQQLLESYLRALLAKVMGLSAAKVDLDVPLYSLGLDSLMAIELKKRIEKDLEVFIALEYFVGLNVPQFVQQLILLIEGKALSEPEEEVSQANLWFSRWQPNPRACLRLFCFSYAGGGASIFSPWSKELPPEIEVCPIQLPGREERLGESSFTRLAPLIQTLVPLITPYLDIPFAFFGHSLGALISFELARELRRQNLPSPIHLFVSASRAPHILDLDLPIHRLPDSKFLESLRRLNGTPEEVLQNPELMQLFLPALRADFAILETYFYATQERLHCPISAFGGVKDNIVSQQELAAWCDQTDGDFRLAMFPGDHFFLHANRQQLLQAIAQEIQKPVLK